jgi:hypothetical protein
MLLGPIAGADVDEWERMIAVNQKGLLYMTNAALPHLLTAAEDGRDVEELLAEPGIDVDHVTVCRWVQRFTPLLASNLTTVPASPARPLILQRDSAAEHASSERDRCPARNNAATTSSLTLDIADVYVDIYVTT